MTPRDMITSALRAVNTLFLGQQPTSSMFQDGLEMLNLLLESWSAEELMPSDLAQHEFDLWAATTNYSINNGVDLDSDAICLSQAPGGAGDLTINGSLGSGGVATMDVPRHVIITSSADDSGRTFTVTGTNTYGDPVTEEITGPNTATTHGNFQFKTVTQVAIDAASAGNILIGTDYVLSIRRPMMVIDGFVRNSSGVDNTVFPVTRERYNTIRDKDEAGTSILLYYNRLHPSGELYLHPIPTAGVTVAGGRSDRLFIDCWMPFRTIASTDIDTDINLPGAFLLALRWNLAAELSPEYGRNVSGYIFARAIRSKEVIMWINARQPKLTNINAPIRQLSGQNAVNTN